MGPLLRNPSNPSSLTQFLGVRLTDLLIDMVLGQRWVGVALWFVPQSKVQGDQRSIRPVKQARGRTMVLHEKVPIPIPFLLSYLLITELNPAPLKLFV